MAGAIPQQVLQASPGLWLHQSVGKIRIKSRLTSLDIVKPGLPSREPSFCFPCKSSRLTCWTAAVAVPAASAPAAGNGALGNASSAIRLGDTTIASGSVKAATTSKITVTGSFNASDSNFGGATLVNRDRGLVWRQTTAGQNGIYTWNSSTLLLTLVESGSAAGVYGSQYLVGSGSFANQRFWINTSNATTTGFVPDDIANPDLSLLVSAPVTIGRAIQVVSNSSSGVHARQLAHERHGHVHGQRRARQGRHAPGGHRRHGAVSDRGLDDLRQPDHGWLRGQRRHGANRKRDRRHRRPHAQ